LAPLLQPGTQVLLKSGEVASVFTMQKHERQRYDIVELITRQESFTVSATHRIVVLDEAGLQQPRRAGELRVDDKVIVGDKERKLTRVAFRREMTSLYSITFSPDRPVETYTVRYGILSHGEPFISPEGLANFTEEDCLQAMPLKYDD